MHLTVSKKTLMRYVVLGAAALSLSSAAGITLWPDKAYAKCKFHTDAGLGNGSSIFGDPGNSGAHNQAGNAPATPNSAAAQADTAHEIDDVDEPN